MGSCKVGAGPVFGEIVNARQTARKGGSRGTRTVETLRVDCMKLQNYCINSHKDGVEAKVPQELVQVKHECPGTQSVATGLGMTRII